MYLSTYALNWLAQRIAGQAITVSLHTGEPGDDGTGNRATANDGTAGVTTLVAAADWSAEANADTADNDDDIEVFTPNATSAGQDLSHVGYWFGADFFGWAALAATVQTVDGTPFTIAAGKADFTFLLAA